METEELRHVWNICPSLDASAATAATAAINEYYKKEEMASRGFAKEPFAVITKAFPRHHALVSSALVSASKLTNRDFPKYVSPQYCLTPSSRPGAGTALTSIYQKHHLVALSAMSGLLVSRLFLTGHSFGHHRFACADHENNSWFAPRHLFRVLKRNAQFTTKYIHSALASDILIGYRYYRHLARNSKSRFPVGNNGKSYETEDALTPEIIEDAKRELSALYASQVDRLNAAVYQFKRGYINLHEIQNDPQFERLMESFWAISFKMVKQIRDNKLQQLPPPPAVGAPGHHQPQRFIDFENEKKEHLTKQLMYLSDTSSVCVLAPRLYDYDVVHLFDSARQSYAKYVRTVKNTSIRLANDGVTTSLLGFAAIEPEMVCEWFAPKMNEKYQTLAKEYYANHVPSRDPIYGALRVKHLKHIPRTAVAVQCVEREVIHEEEGSGRPLPGGRALARVNKNKIV